VEKGWEWLILDGGSDTDQKNCRLVQKRRIENGQINLTAGLKKGRPLLLRGLFGDWAAKVWGDRVDGW
jgi:hypothetical protein